MAKFKEGEGGFCPSCIPYLGILFCHFLNNPHPYILTYYAEGPLPCAFICFWIFPQLYAY